VEQIHNAHTIDCALQVDVVSLQVDVVSLQVDVVSLQVNVVSPQVNVVSLKRPDPLIKVPEIRMMFSGRLSWCR
jgi:hypothetical protein